MGDGCLLVEIDADPVEVVKMMDGVGSLIVESFKSLIVEPITDDRKPKTVNFTC